ncbi:MAG: acyl-CoA dehydrogenase family protein [Pseudomonadota bacterium]|jgi:pimeloyl-CoA dehydrogenase small subunit
MDFTFTEEQSLLRNSVQRFIQDKYAFETRKKIVASPEGWSTDNWRGFAELGLLGIPFTEEYGGMGGGAVETMIIMEEFGKGLVVEPYLQTVVLCGGLIDRLGTEAQKKELLPKIASGELVLALAYAEPQGRFNLADLTCRAQKSGDGYVLTGNKAVVMAAPWADKLLVTARTSHGQRDRDGVSLFIVDRNAKGLDCRDYPTLDGGRASEISFDDVKIQTDALLGQEGKTLAAIEEAADRAIAALSAEAVGCMRVLTHATVEYCKTRKQFGQPIGNFQVLQHRMADMFIECEQSLSITYMVNLKLEESAQERARAASAAKVQIGKSGRFVGQQAVQLHGGMGMTDELNIGHYFKRLTMIDAQFGNVDFHLKRFAAAH